MLASNTERWLWWPWIGDNAGVIRHDLWVHIELTVIAVVAGLIVSLPLGIWAQRRPRTLGPVLGGAGVLYTIPALAAFALLIPYTGSGNLTAVIPLTAYTLLILVRNIVTGLDGVPDEALEAADAMGLTRSQRLWRLELPLATPAIMAGVRVATVSTIGMLTIAALVGLGGLGHLIMVGLNRPIRTAVTVGAVLSVAFAVVADICLAVLQRKLSPWANNRSVSTA
ncbi:MAG TPA: ABC transporter permease [Acidimicrobiales bacterium]|nr:ABC transporter permease [Acidimicrobiales bacterium]